MDWEQRSWDAWWAEDGAAAITAREHAYRGYKESGDARGAARMALWLALDHHEFHGEHAVAQGWFARCERILADLDPGPEHGWLAAFQAGFLLDEGDSVAARALGGDARQLGRALGLTALEMMGLATEGLAMVEQGDVAPGMRCLDEATAAALGGEYEEAERELLDAQAALVATRPPWAAEATVRLADLRRRQGRLDEAERLFVASEPHLLAALGRGELCLDRGQPDAAIGFAEQLLRRLPERNVTQRAGALELLVRARASRGDRAQRFEIAETIGGDPQRAAQRHCEGVVERAAGDGAAARAAFEDAAALYAACGAPFEAERSRRELSAPASGALSAREAEVLRLVARGLTDRQIAAELVLSPHTVHRHVANVYAKLGCSSRAAAVARATDLGLLG